MKKILLLTQHISSGGGVNTMVRFLVDVLENSAEFEPYLVSLAISSRDEASVRLLSPATWLKGVQIKPFDWQVYRVPHVGAFLTEFESQRYKPRPQLDAILSEVDLVQVVTGFPALGNVVSTCPIPKVMFVATTVAQERQALLAQTHGITKLPIHLMTKLVTRIEQKALHAMDHVFAESEYTFQLLQSQLKTNNLSLSLPGVDTNLFKPPVHYAVDGPILFVGRLGEPRKNITLLLKAFALFRKRQHSSKKLVLCGRTDLPTHEYALIETLHLTEHVEIRRNVSIGALVQLYQSASQFVLSSDEEGLGIVLLEAMASGLPVVSTRCGGPESCVIDGETGILTPKNDVEALADAIGRLDANPTLRYQMHTNALALIQAKFTHAKASEVYLAQYRKLLHMH